MGDDDDGDDGGDDDDDADDDAAHVHWIRDDAHCGAGLAAVDADAGGAVGQAHDSSHPSAKPTPNIHFFQTRLFRLAEHSTEVLSVYSRSRRFEHFSPHRAKPHPRVRPHSSTLSQNPKP